MPIGAITTLAAFMLMFVIAVQVRRTETTAAPDLYDAVRLSDITVRNSDIIKVRTLVAHRVLIELRKRSSSSSSFHRSTRTGHLSSCEHDSRREPSRTLGWWFEDPVDDRVERVDVDDVLATARMLSQHQSRMREPTTTVAPRTKSA